MRAFSLDTKTEQSKITQIPFTNESPAHKTKIQSVNDESAYFSKTYSNDSFTRFFEFNFETSVQTELRCIDDCKLDVGATCKLFVANSKLIIGLLKQ